MDDWTASDEMAQFLIEAEEEIAYITGDWTQVWGMIACSTGGGDPRKIWNKFAMIVQLVDRRLRDGEAA